MNLPKGDVPMNLVNSLFGLDENISVDLGVAQARAIRVGREALNSRLFAAVVRL